MTERERARSTRVEHQERLDQVEAWLAQRRSRSEVLRLIRQQWGVSERHADRYISEATTQWRVRVEPERGENRSRNLATCDVAIADSFRVGKMRDVAALLRLRATIDGSLATPATLVSVPPSDPTLDQNPADLVATVGGSLVTLLRCSDPTPAIRQSVARLIEELGAYLGTTSVPPG